MIRKIIISHLIKTPADPEIKIPPVGSCIYCGSGFGKDPFGDEHVLPSGMGGNLVLQDSSCRDCEKIINLYETRVMKGHIGLLRKKMSIRSRRSRGKRAKDITTHQTFVGNPIDSDDPLRLSNEFSSIPVIDLPKVMFCELIESRPSIMTGRTDPIDITVRLINLEPKHNPEINFGINFSSVIGDYLRMIAKIAHSFAVSILGSNGFKPYLLDIIIGDELKFERYIGTIPGDKKDALHFMGIELSPFGINKTSHLSFEYKSVFVVYIHLFCQYETPVYEVVVGEPLAKA